MKTSPEHFTASQIAVALVCSKRTILKALARTKPDGVIIVRGNETPTWTPENFPASIIKRFNRQAIAAGVSAPDFIAAQLKLVVAGVESWKPTVPLSDITAACLDGAMKLRDALLPALERENSHLLTAADRARLGLADYHRVFGHEITERHWQRLVERTVERDGGAEDFSRLELYLPKHPQRKAVAKVLPHEAAFRQFNETIQTFNQPTAPTRPEIAALWSDVFEWYDASAGTQRGKRALRRPLLKFLHRHAPWLAQTERALRVAFERKYARWLESGKTAVALLDGREQKRGVPVAEPLPQEDVDRITWHAARNCGGRVAQAVRDFAERGPRSGLSETTLDLICHDGASKSYVPNRLRATVQRDTRLIRPYLLGKKAIDDATAHISRDYSKLVSMEVVCADDFTLPVYFYVPDGNGWFTLTRGQCLVFMDVRSWKVIAWSLQPERNYNSLVIRTLMNRVCAGWGLPGVWYFERGIWNTARAVKGEMPFGWKPGLSWVETKVGWENLGVRFVHATRARSKPVERLGGLLQDLMEGVRGYCGRDERRDCPALTKQAMDEVAARRVQHPSELFLSFDEWNTELAGIIDRYNAASQDGETLAGLSPDEAFEAAWPHADPPTRFDATCWHLVAHCVRQVKVTANGVCFRVGKRTFVYRNERTGQNRGKQVLAWFDPETPESLCVTDLNQRNPYLVERSRKTDFLAESGDPTFERELSNIAAHSAYPKARFHVLKAKFQPTFRRNQVDAETAEMEGARSVRRTRCVRAGITQCRITGRSGESSPAAARVASRGKRTGAKHMSSTRHAAGNSPLRQERFASSQEFERGLLPNLVARRCAVLDRAEDRELVWFLQLLSHQERGLKKLAAELCTRYADRLATPSMRKFGFKTGQIYNASQVKTVRSEIPGGVFDFLLKGEIGDAELMNLPGEPRDRVEALTSDWQREHDEQLAKLEAAAERRPAKYLAAEFAKRCTSEAATRLEKHLVELCLDPGRAIADGEPWYFPTLVSTVRDLKADWIAARQPAAVTSIGSGVCDALDYALESRRLVLIDGKERIGKSHAARVWCEQHPGQARYCELESGNEETGFFRLIAIKLGLSGSLNLKAHELKRRIADSLQHGHLLLVLDEAHWLWPQTLNRYALPARINWVMTSLVNQGVPVALITTPQFLKAQKQVESRTGWTSGQFIGRIGHYQRLPDQLSPNELEAVARAVVPNADARTIKALVSYAQLSKGYLAGIETVTDRARSIARKAGRERVEFRDVMRALDENVIPSDTAFADAMRSEKPARKRAVTVPNARNGASVLEQPAGRSVRPLPSTRRTFDAEQSETELAET